MSSIKIDEEGTIHFINQAGRLHRENDLPAVIRSDGEQRWYKNGQIHRGNDLPAMIYPNGSKFWYFNNVPHRGNNMPAFVFSDGEKQYWQYGKPC